MMKNKKLTKTKWREFFKIAFNVKAKDMEFLDTTVLGINGYMSYEAWILNVRIYVQFTITNETFSSAYFNIDTFEYDYAYTDKQRQLAEDEKYEAWKEEILNS